MSSKTTISSGFASNLLVIFCAKAYSLPRPRSRPWFKGLYSTSCIAVRVLFIHVQPVIRLLVPSTNVDRYRRGLDRDVHYTTISKTEWIHFPAAPGWYNSDNGQARIIQYIKPNILSDNKKYFLKIEWFVRPSFVWAKGRGLFKKYSRKVRQKCSCMFIPTRLRLRYVKVLCRQISID
jgi:hypothetical protein